MISVLPKLIHENQTCVPGRRITKNIHIVQDLIDHINNGNGTVVSVKAVSTNLTPSSGTVTIANGAGTGNTVTITGVTGVIPQGFGMILETTSTLHTYAFHRLQAKATEVNAVAIAAPALGPSFGVAPSGT